MKRSAFALASLVLAILAWYLWTRSGSETSEAGFTTAPTAVPTSGRTPVASTGAPRPPEPPLERSTLAAALNSPATDIRADLRLVSEVLDAFRTNFPRTGNPVGDNAEITAVLSGRNRLRLALIPPEHPAINRQGELCDRWGTPFFFHAESGTRMEIRSAGPDRKMWTADDVVYQP